MKLLDDIAAAKHAAVLAARSALGDAAVAGKLAAMVADAAKGDPIRTTIRGQIVIVAQVGDREIRIPVLVNEEI